MAARGGYAEAPPSYSQVNPPNYSQVGSKRPNQDYLQQEVKLYENRHEREKMDNFAELYSCIKTLDRLEKAFFSDSIPDVEYTSSCNDNLKKIRTLQKVCGIKNVDSFMREYHLECKAAHQRIQEGVPQTHQTNAMGGAMQAVAFFITAMDSLKLNMIDIDQVVPLLNDIQGGLNSIPQLKDDFEGKLKIAKWLQLLANAGASDKLDDSQVRQLLFDLDSSLNALHTTLRQ